MNLEKPEQPTPEKRAEVEATRTLSDAELIKSGAQYVFDKDNDGRLEVTGDQVEKIRQEIDAPNKFPKVGSVDSTEQLSMVKDRLSWVSRFFGMFNADKGDLSYELISIDHGISYLQEAENVIEDTELKNEVRELIGILRYLRKVGEENRIGKKPFFGGDIMKNRDEVAAISKHINFLTRKLSLKLNF